MSNFSYKIIDDWSLFKRTSLEKYIRNLNSVDLTKLVHFSLKEIELKNKESVYHVFNEFCLGFMEDNNKI